MGGLLRDIRLTFFLDRNEDDVVGEIEIDWIELSGFEELLQGELPPPHVEYFRFDGAGFFAPPVFYPITPGIGIAAAYGERAGILTDLDGDGDADLFASWGSEGSITEEGGWTMALNDGEGTFETVRTEEVGSWADRGACRRLDRRWQGRNSDVSTYRGNAEGCGNAGT